MSKPAYDNSTFQSNIHTHDQANLTDYALFLGGLNVTHNSLLQYDPLKTGFGRLFMVRKPTFVNKKIGDKLNKFKHILEYGNTAINGLDNIELQGNDMTGGYAGRSVSIPSIAQDTMNEFTVTVYELSGSPVREVIQYWINGMADIQTGLATYYQDTDEVNNPDSPALPITMANQTAEFIYVVTDQTGRNVEYACMLANCWPKRIPLDHFNYQSATHDLVQLEIPFSCIRYMSPEINEKAKTLITKYNILMNTIGFNSGLADAEFMKASETGKFYDETNGKLRTKRWDDRTKFIMTPDNRDE